MHGCILWKTKMEKVDRFHARVLYCAKSVKFFFLIISCSVEVFNVIISANIYNLSGGYGGSNLFNPGCAFCLVPGRDQKPFHTVVFGICAICGIGSHDLSGHLVFYRGTGIGGGGYSYCLGSGISQAEFIDSGDGGQWSGICDAGSKFPVLNIIL